MKLNGLWVTSASGEDRLTAFPATAAKAGATGSAAPAAATATMAALQPWPVLSQGHTGAWPPATIRSLQYLLNARGAKLTVDGKFGARTKAAVIAFQRAMSTGSSALRPRRR